MLKVLAGDLSATWNLDGLHGQRYVDRRVAIAQSLCEQLVLHDQVIVPTQDYLTAAGLIALFGERTLIHLLEADRLRFARIRGVFCYVRGKGPEGSLGVFHDPAGKKPHDATLEESVSLGLNAVNMRLTEKSKIAKLLLEKSQPMELSQVLNAVRDSTYADFRHTSLWRDYYNFPKSGLLKLPGMKRMQVRVIGPTTDATSDPVDALLALCLTNIELYLSKQFNCTSMSTGSPVGDSLLLKLPRLKLDHAARDRLWSFLEVASVPNLAALTLTDSSKFHDVLKLTQGRNASAFRSWFHQTSSFSQQELYAKYVDLLHEVPWAQSAPVKTLRFGISFALDAINPLLGKAGDAVDTFLLDRLLRGNSAKYFVEDLRTFTGKIGIGR